MSKLYIASRHDNNFQVSTMGVFDTKEKALDHAKDLCTITAYATAGTVVQWSYVKVYEVDLNGTGKPKKIFGGWKDGDRARKIEDAGGVFTL